MSKSLNLKEAKNILQRHYEKQLDVAKKSGIKRDIERIIQKQEHSYEVLDMGERLIQGEEGLRSLDERIIEYMKVVLILHDLGRFYEIGEKKLGGMYHGDYGAENILRDIEGVDDLFILLPIKHHDKLNLTGLLDEFQELGLSDEEREFIALISQFVRDSDKMANFDYLSRVVYISPTQNRNLYFSKSVFDSFKRGEMVDNRICNTVFDKALNFISWSFDLGFDVSKRLFVEKGNAKGLLENFKKLIDVIAEEKIGVCDKSEIGKQKGVLLESLLEIEDVLKDRGLM